MGKGFFVSKPVGAVLAILGLGAVATIIALSVVYVQEKDKNNSNNVSPTDGGAPTTAAPVTTAPPQEPWNRYRLPTSLSPSSYKVTLWPRLTANSSTGLYIFTGKEEPSTCLSAYPSVHPSLCHPSHCSFSHRSRANQPTVCG